MQSTTSRDLAVGVFDDRDDAERAINGLKDAGFNPDQISVMARDRDQQGSLAEDTGTEAGTGAATGALTGGLLGGVAGWLIGIGALAIPGIGPIIAAGPLAAAIGGAALGAAGGGLIGALTGAGVPEDEAKHYEDRFKSGGILVTVNAPGRYDDARTILREYNGHDYDSRTDSDAGVRTTTRGDRDRDLDRDRPESETGSVAGGSVVGGSVGAVAGGLVGGPPGAVAGAAIGGSAGAAGGDAATETDDEARERRGSDHDATRARDYSASDMGTTRRTSGLDADTGMSSTERGHGDRDRPESETGSVVGGSAVGGTVGAVAGGLVGGPPGAVAGAAIGGTAGAAGGDAATETEDEARERRRREGEGDRPLRRD